jgi:hypothetical protein
MKEREGGPGRYRDDDESQDRPYLGPNGRAGIDVKLEKRRNDKLFRAERSNSAVFETQKTENFFHTLTEWKIHNRDFVDGT